MDRTETGKTAHVVQLSDSAASSGPAMTALELHHATLRRLHAAPAHPFGHGEGSPAQRAGVSMNGRHKRLVRTSHPLRLRGASSRPSDALLPSGNDCIAGAILLHERSDSLTGRNGSSLDCGRRSSGTCPGPGRIARRVQEPAQEPPPDRPVQLALGLVADGAGSTKRVSTNCTVSAHFA